MEKAVILAAGKGTRMRGLCDELPKPLLPVANRPVLTHTIAHLEQAGIRQVLLVIGHQAHVVRNALGQRWGGVDLHYVVQHDPKGTGQATALAEDFAAGEPFLMLFGDIVTSRQVFADVVSIYASERPEAILSVRYFRDPASGGAVYLDGDRVEKIVERPEPGATTTHYINAGVFVFPPEIFGLLRQVELSPRGEYELTDAIRMLLERGATVRAYEIERFWVNLTDPASYLEAQRELFGEEPPPPPEVPDATRVDPPVVVGQGCRLADCRLGPNVSIGNHCAIGPGAVVRDAVVMDGARVGAGARVEHAVVGLGAEVFDGSELVGDPDGDAAFILHGQKA